MCVCVISKDHDGQIIFKKFAITKYMLLITDCKKNKRVSLYLNLKGSLNRFYLYDTAPLGPTPSVNVSNVSQY